MECVELTLKWVAYKHFCIAILNENDSDAIAIGLSVKDSTCSGYSSNIFIQNARSSSYGILGIWYGIHYFDTIFIFNN